METLGIADAYAEVERGERVTLQIEGMDTQSIRVDGLLWLGDHDKPLQIISRGGRRFALGYRDRVTRGF